MLVGIVIVLLVLEDKCETYDPVGYIQASIPWAEYEEFLQPPPLAADVGDKIIVVPALEEDDVSWVREELSEYVSIHDFFLRA